MSTFLSPLFDLPHISLVVPCKSPVTQNKLPLQWMGQNNIEMSLFRRNWSYLGKHKSIVSIIAMSPAPPRLFHKDHLTSFHLCNAYYFPRHIFKMYFLNLICVVNGYFLCSLWHNSMTMRLQYLLELKRKLKKRFTSVYCWHPNFY